MTCWQAYITRWAGCGLLICPCHADMVCPRNGQAAGRHSCKAHLNGRQRCRAGRAVDCLADSDIAEAGKGTDVSCLHPLCWHAREVVVHEQLADLAGPGRLVACQITADSEQCAETGDMMTATASSPSLNASVMDVGFNL